MAWLVCGTIPDQSFSLYLGTGHCDPEAGLLHLADLDPLPVQRGSATLVATAFLAAHCLHMPPPDVLLVGDTGDGSGSRALYARLAGMLGQEYGETRYAGLTFHYLFPELDGHNRVLAALEDCEQRPLLVADAGFMYAAKMSGYAQSYDLFTPDAGELAFLADEAAPHPLYTRGFLSAGEADVPELADRAWKTGNAAKNLLVKGKSDVLVSEGQIVARVDEPMVPALEAIGGTGDLVAGLATALLYKGLPMHKACLAAARAARRAGALARPTPATQVAAILPFIAQALQQTLAEDEPAMPA